MRRFSGTWFLCVTLKCAAVYLSLDFFLQPFADPSRILNWPRHLVDTFLTGAIWYVLAEILRLSANAEAYSRAVYGTLRKKSDRPNTQAAAMPPTFPLPENNLQYSAPVRYQRDTQRRYSTAPVRSVTVLKPRSEHEVHPARPAGSVVPYEKLDPSADQPLPFDD
ncbi:MAG: hypothetical protein IPK52_04240 [Chloroflexi bacterium]|nr:hypothetical protein [Chloroflexota bacterium]